MNEPTIRCSNCKTDIKLTESLAAPLLLTIRKEYEMKISNIELEISNREAKLNSEKENLKKAQSHLELTIEQRLKSERLKIVQAEEKKAKEALGDKISEIEQELANKQELLKDRELKLSEARKRELDLRKEREKLNDEKKAFELTIQSTLDEERTKILEKAQKEADNLSRLKIAEKDKTITDLQTKLQDALRKAEQGSQQLQGEIQELDLEKFLRNKFPQDNIEPVPKGVHGGDTLHFVYNGLSQQCGIILWESKRTKNWNDSWLSKIKDDQRSARADISIIMSQSLPKGVKLFDFIEGVWVIEPQCLIPVATMIRQSLIELSGARHASDGQQTKMEMIYQYLTGQKFRHRVEAIVEKFSDMKEDLDKERKIMTRQWAKREEQIQCVIDSTAGMYGDLQGIAGRSLQEVEGLSFLKLESQ